MREIGLRWLMGKSHRGRFGTILSCEVIRDKKSGDSLQYAFIEFDKKEEAEAVSPV